MTEQFNGMDPMEFDAFLDDIVHSAAEGPDWRNKPVELDENGCDYPRFCKFYGNLALGHFCDHSCTELLP
jgi:hypothetical protein